MSDVVLRCHFDGSGWAVTAPNHDGVVHVRSLATVLEAPGDMASGLFGRGRVDDHEVRVEVVVDDEVAHAVGEAKITRDLAARHQDDAAVAARVAVRALTATAGFSLSDAAAMLGISRQRVHKILESETVQPTTRSGSDGLDVVAAGDLD